MLKLALLLKSARLASPARNFDLAGWRSLPLPLLSLSIDLDTEPGVVGQAGWLRFVGQVVGNQR
jgi:hypothetical protein